METLFLEPYTILLIAGFIGFFMAFGIGANDVANSMGTSVGSKAITIKQAIIIAAIFEFLGAFLAGGEVTSTIRKGIVDPQLYVDETNIFIIGMLSALLAGGTWLGLNDDGVIAGLLNRINTLGPKEGFRSRGELPLEALDHAEAKTAEAKRTSYRFYAAARVCREGIAKARSE